MVNHLSNTLSTYVKWLNTYQTPSPRMSNGWSLIKHPLHICQMVDHISNTQTPHCLYSPGGCQIVHYLWSTFIYVNMSSHTLSIPVTFQTPHPTHINKRSYIKHLHRYQTVYHMLNTLPTDVKWFFMYQTLIPWMSNGHHLSTPNPHILKGSLPINPTNVKWLLTYQPPPTYIKLFLTYQSPHRCQNVPHMSTPTDVNV